MKSIIIKKNSINSKRLFISENRILFIFIIIVILGVIIGSLSFNFISTSTKEEVFKTISNFLQESEKLSIIKLFSRSLVNDYIYLFILFVSGVCALGLPIIFVLPLLKGISTGVLISYIYTQQGLNGFVYYLIILSVPATLMLMCIIFACREAYYMSLGISMGVFTENRRTYEKSSNFFIYLKRFLIFSFAVIAISFIDGVITNIFSKIL